MKKFDENESSGQSVTPPDGGWGWAVVFASFMIHIIGKVDFIDVQFSPINVIYVLFLLAMTPLTLLLAHS